MFFKGSRYENVGTDSITLLEMWHDDDGRWVDGPGGGVGWVGPRPHAQTRGLGFGLEGGVVGGVLDVRGDSQHHGQPFPEEGGGDVGVVDGFDGGKRPPV